MFSHIQLFVTQWTLSYQPPLSMEFSSIWKNTEMNCHSLLQGIFPNPGIKPGSPELQADSLLSEPSGSSMNSVDFFKHHGSQMYAHLARMTPPPS